MEPELEEYYRQAQKQFDEEYTLDTAFRNLEHIYRRLLYLRKVREELDRVQECNVPQILDVIEDRLLRAMACIINVKCGTPEDGDRYNYEQLRNWLSERIEFGVQV